MSFYSINAHASILNEERTEYVGSEGGAFEGACWHAGKLTRGDPDAHETLWSQAVSETGYYQNLVFWAD